MDSIYKLITSWKLSFFMIFSLFSSTVHAQNCQGHTLTMGGWGAPNTSNPNVSYLYANFSNTFPNGLVLGCASGNKLVLTSPQSITDFLPSGGTPSVLNNNYSDPGSLYSNTLAGQLVAVMLAVGFDSNDPGFSSSNISLGNYIIASGPFQGKTVNQFLNLANDFIGNCQASQYTASDFNAAADAINRNYDEGSQDLGFLKCCTLEASISSTEIKCFGGLSTITASATNGVGNYTYLWSTGETTPSIEVPAGTYQVTVKDESNCSKSVSITVVQPEMLMVDITSTSILCNGGQATLTAVAGGGTGNYSYLWSTGETTQSIQVSAGTYSVVVQDSNLCSKSAEITVIAPDPLVLTIDKMDVLCYNGTATVSANVTGGTPSYTYLWSNGATTQTVELPIGQYSVTVTDANGCTISQSFEIKPISCQGTTVTQGGWGAPANGNNWGVYRDANFATVFTAPDYLKIGAGSKVFTFTTALAVKNFLAKGGTPSVLPGSATNPANNKNTLANNLVALALSMKFDEADSNFSSSNTVLKDMIITSGPMMGSTVQQAWDLANKIIGGISTQYSPSEINTVIDNINRNFDNGTSNLGYLACPCSDQKITNDYAKTSIDNAKIMNKALQNQSIKVYPNPTRGDININLEGGDSGSLKAYLFDSNGRIIADLSGSISKGRGVSIIHYENYDLPEGIYILKLKSSQTEKSYKIMVKK